MTTLYRVENPLTDVGLWYNAQGRQVDFIRDLDAARCRDLPMGHDPSLVGGWFSATDSLEQMCSWISASDAVQLADRGHGLYAVEVAEEGWRITREPYVHAVFRSELVLSRRLLPWDVLELTP